MSVFPVEPQALRTEKSKAESLYLMKNWETVLQHPLWPADFSKNNWSNPKRKNESLILL